MDENLVLSTDWENLSLDKLFEQRTLLYNRYEYLKMTNKDYAANMLEGLNRLESIIAKAVS